MGPGDCQACPSQTSSASGSDGLTDCACLAGYTATSDGVACDACDSGDYKVATGAGECSTCPAGTSSASGSDGLTDCKCLAGYTPNALPLGSEDISNVENDWGCVECSANMFKRNLGNMACDACPGEMQSNAGSDAQSDCLCMMPLGESSDGVCVDCAQGMYKDWIGGFGNLCKACPGL